MSREARGLPPGGRGEDAAADVIGAIDHDASAHFSDRTGRRAIETAAETHHAITDIAGQHTTEIGGVTLKRNGPRIVGMVETRDRDGAAARSEVDGIGEISGRYSYVVRWAGNASDVGDDLTDIGRSAGGRHVAGLRRTACDPEPENGFRVGRIASRPESPARKVALADRQIRVAEARRQLARRGGGD